ncbi:MAG: hypothetical protein J5846_01575 [Desulfovibrio sp.]|nr:hypothetical protein [Desulfovibrio sp.]
MRCFGFCLILLWLSVLPCQAHYGEDSIYPSPEAAFSPERPELHGVWKGHRTLPLGQMQTLCFAVADYLGVHRENAGRFLLEIAAAESDFGYYVRQVKGPAQSVWQIEPATARDLHERLPKRQPELYRKILALRDPALSEEENIVTNLDYGAAFCLGVLTLKGLDFSKLSCLELRAQAWKQKYNTYLGKGTFEGYCQKAMRYLGAKLSGQGVLAGAFDPALVTSSDDLFAERNKERYLLLPADFDASEIGRYYARKLREEPQVFAEVPDAVLQSRQIQSIMGSLTLELVRKVQQNPAAIAQYTDMPDAIFLPLVRAAMNENAIICYPCLPKALQQDAEILRLYESQKLLRQKLGRMP